MSSIEDWITRLLPIISNFPFALASNRALAYGLPFEAFLFMFVALFTSPLYHLCMGFPAACLWSVYKHHVVDFWSAELTIPVMSLRFVRFRMPYLKLWIILVATVAIGFIVTGTESGLMNQAIIAGVSLGFVVLYLVWHRLAHGYWPQYDLIQLALGIGFTSLGVCFFVVQEWWPPYYGYNHSYWHSLTAVGMYFLIGIREPEDDMLLRPASTVHRIANAINLYIGNVVPSILKPAWEDRYQQRIIDGYYSSSPSLKGAQGYTHVEGFALFAPMDKGDKYQ